MRKFLPVLLGLTAAPALAQAPAPAPAAEPQIVKRADLEKKLAGDFDKADSNNDGFISRDEMLSIRGKALQEAQAKVQQNAAEQFAKLDADKNGQLSLQEFQSAMNVRANETPEQAVAKFDANKDARVSRAEFQNSFMAIFDRADTNKDGTISPEEQAAARRPR